MDIAQLAFGNLIVIIGFALLMAGVFKIFQMSAALTELKELINDVKRNTQGSAPPPVAPYAFSGSGEELLRAVSAEIDAAGPPPIPEPHLQADLQN